MGKKSGLVGVAVLSLPVLELFALIAVGGALGFFRTMALLLLLSVAGFYVLKARVAQLAAVPLGKDSDLEVSPRAVGSAVLAVLGGLLMVLPGFVTAIGGLALQISPLRRALSHRVTSQFTTTVGTVGTRFGTSGPNGFGVHRGDVIETDLAADRNDRPSSPSSSSSPELT